MERGERERDVDWIGLDWIVGGNLRGDDEEWARRRGMGAIGDMKISKSVKEKLGSFSPKTPS